MRRLLATYRLQLRGGMTFAKARTLATYWQRLGVSHLYLSPILKARTGSPHGYDVTDPARVDPALGDERGLAALADALGHAGLGILLDIVPNHMAADPENPYFDDLLRQGRRSRCAAWFDVDWGEGAIVLPFLGEALPRALARGALHLVVEGGEVRVRYFERSFPLDPARLPPGWREEKPKRADLERFCRGAEGRRRLARLLARQSYRLHDWRSGSRVLNYRRFFDIDELIALRVEDPQVFEATHAKTLELLARGLVDGLRVDHVDGLADPRAYLVRLRDAARACGRPQAPILVEKILATGERLRDDWPVDGTTGYEFLNQLEAVFLDPTGVAGIEANWRRVTRRRASFEETARAGKRLALAHGLVADVRRLARALMVEPARRGPPERELRRALVETIAALRIYRTYADERGRLPAHERRWLAGALGEARRARTSRAALRRLVPVLLGGAGAPGRGRRVPLLRRFEQLSGPAAAKGVEDTALYVHVPLVSRNEVGGEPDTDLERAVEAFHAAASERQQRWPRALLAATTHDTKRSADVRSRLDVLSELPEAWADAVRRWRSRNLEHRRRVGGRRFPDANTELLLYQTLVGIWPLAPAARPGPPPAQELARIEERTQLYMRKAAREAKVHTRWLGPNAGFEAALERFIRAILRPQPRGGGWSFVHDLDGFAREVARPGLWNSLARLLVQLTAPGVPDLYQGDELWNLALVDPDNRRPVDFTRRRRLLGEIERHFASGAQGRRRFIEEIVTSPEDGRVKLHVTQRTLRTRRRHPQLFAAGEYVPLRGRGPKASHLLAFARRHGGALGLVVVPRLSRTLVGNAVDAPCGERLWGRTELALPRQTPAGVLRSPLTGERIALERGTRGLPLSRLLASFPVGLWLWEPRPGRS